MSMEFVNRICPNCKNPNYVVLLGDFSTAYKYKCINCNRYFNDIDFYKEPLQPVGMWKRGENMTTRMAMEALSELSEKINDCNFDLFPKTYYSTAIDIAVKALANYERLLEEMLSYQQQSYVNMEQQRAIQALRYKIFKEGGDAP